MNSDMKYSIDSTSPEATSELGLVLAAKLQGNETIVLVGDLGAGKTQFVRGLAGGLGSDEVVQSPTFTLSREYACSNDLQLHHYDFYRLGEAGIAGQEFAESVEDNQVVTVVEWADVVEDTLPQNVIRINIFATGEQTRTLESNKELA